MKKEGEDSSVSTYVKSIFSIVQDVALGGIADRFKEGLNNIFDDAQKRLDKSNERFIQNLVITFLELTSVVFICVGFIYLMIDLIGLEKSYAFLIMGGLLIVCAIFFKKYVNLKNKVKEAE